MANEIAYHDPAQTTSGLSTVYAVLIASDGRYVNASTGALLTASAANWPTAKIALSDATTLYRYLGSVPSGTAADRLNVRVHLQAGGSAATSDAMKGFGELRWNGTAEVDALPNAAANASGGLLTFGTSTGQFNPSGGKAAATIATGDMAGTQTFNMVGSITGNLSGSVGSVTGNVGGTVASVVGAVGSISGVTFPGNFSVLGINVSGHISRVALVDTVTTLTGYSTPPTASAISTQVASDLATAHGVGAWTSTDTGSGDIVVNHDYGGTDALRYTHNGVGVDDATVRAYLASEYAGGTYTIRGQTTTGSDGRWVQPMYLDAGDYKISFVATGYETAIATVTVA